MTRLHATRRLCRLRASLALLIPVALVACGSVPNTSFYTLVPAAQTRSAPGAPIDAAMSVSIGPVSVPEAVDRPQFIVRVGPHEQRLLEQRRWSQSLPREIDSALLAHLERLLPGARITILGQSAAADARWRLSIDVLRFEAEVGQQTTFDALWSLRDPAGRVLDSGRFADQRAVAPLTYEALAASQAASVERLAQRLAERLRQQPLTPPSSTASAPTAATPTQ